MDHWDERSKQPGVAGIAKYMAAFIRFLTIMNNIHLANIRFIYTWIACGIIYFINRKKLGLHWVKDFEVQRAVSIITKSDQSFFYWFSTLSGPY